MAGGGGAPAPKIDEPQPHPPKDQLPNVSYCITSPPPWREFFFLFSCNSRFGFCVLLLALNLIPLSSLSKWYIFKSMLCDSDITCFVCWLFICLLKWLSINSFLLSALMRREKCIPLENTTFS